MNNTLRQKEIGKYQKTFEQLSLQKVLQAENRWIQGVRDERIDSFLTRFDEDKLTEIKTTAKSGKIRDRAMRVLMARTKQHAS